MSRITCLVSAFLLMVPMTACEQADKVRGYDTATRVKELAFIIDDEKESIASSDDIGRVVQDLGRAELLVDSWGNPVIVEITSDPDQALSWTIRSVGSDGTRGACCRGLLNDQWHEDAVLAGTDEWLQYW